MKHKADIIAGQSHQIEDLAGKAKVISDVTADMKHFTEAAKDADNSVWAYTLINAANIAVCVVFAVVIVLAGYQVYKARADIGDVGRDMNFVRQDVRSVKNSVQNSDGWSVLEGAAFNEYTFSQEHPAEYQEILENRQKK